MSCSASRIRVATAGVFKVWCWAELVAATEREKIAAMILDTKEWRGRGGFSTLCNDTKHVIAAAIRARKDSA